MSPLSGDPDARSRQLANLRPGARTAPAGNQRALSHGAYAAITRERLDSKVAEIADALAADAPLRDGDGGLPASDGVAVRLLAECLVRLESVSEYLHRKGWEADDGEPRPAVEVEARLRREAADFLDSLGMTPRSRAKLGLDTARSISLADEMADAREARERAEQRIAEESEQ